MEPSLLVTHYPEKKIRVKRSLHSFSPPASLNSDIIEPANVPSAIGQLVKYFQQHRCLLVLDGWETLFATETLAGNYGEGYAGYGQLLKTLGETKHQSCLLLTSSVTPKEVAWLSSAKLPMRSLRLGGLGEAATNILRDKGLSETDKYLELIKAYSGNPLALKIVGTTIKNLFGGCIGEFLKHYPIWGDYGDRLGRQLSRCSELEKLIIDILAAKVEPVSLAKMLLAIKEKTSRQKLLAALESLQRRSLVEAIYGEKETRFVLQPLVKEYSRDR